MRPNFDHGAIFVRAALQVNPYQYLIKNAKKTPFKDEDSYNDQLVKAALQNDISLIAVTDHFAIKDSKTLVDFAADHGLIVFPGFEAVTSEGVHVLCLFDPGTKFQKIERCVGECGVQEDEKALGSKSLGELLRLSPKWDAVLIAAHVTNDGGLLKQLEGKPRQKAWTDDALHAAALSVPLASVDPGMRDILRGVSPGYERPYPVALVHAADVVHPDQLGNDTSWSWVKLSEASIDGLRHAFLDPDSRIRLPGDLPGVPPRRIVSITWTGGFLDGLTLPLSSGLNVLVGPRGSGKSTVIESIRFALGSPILGLEARKAFDGFISEVLRPGTEVTVEVGDGTVGGPMKVIRAIGGGPPRVIGPDGLERDLKPADVLGSVEVFGQHEVAELARLPVERSRLLERFVPTISPPARDRPDVSADLAANRVEFLDLAKKHDRLQARLEALPGIEANLRAYKKAGAQAKLQREAGYRQEEPLLESADALIGEIEEDFAEPSETDLSFLADDAIKGLPSYAELRDIRDALEALATSRKKLLMEAQKAVEGARQRLGEARTARDDRLKTEREEYLKKLRELQAENIDGERYLALEQRHASLVQDKKKLRPMEESQRQLRTQRDALLKEWYSLQEREYDRLEVAAKHVTKELQPSVRIVSTMRGDRTKLCAFLRERLAGQLDNVMRAIETAKALDPLSFTEACRSGSDALGAKLGMQGGRQVEKVCTLAEADLLKLEELWLDPTTSIELKVGEDAAGKPLWRGLESLSTGQKATAILLVLLLDSPDCSPLLVDQPEDDLDNSFIAEDVVPKLRSEKHGRQFMLSTHNPNIPVLGDAEQVVRLTAEGEAAAGGKATVESGHIGSLDRASIRTVVESLEGGKAAFERRRRRYGY